jgi:hypothetical protein
MIILHYEVYSSTLKKGTADSYETLVHMYQTIRHKITEDNNLLCDSLKYLKKEVTALRFERHLELGK